VAVPAGAVSGAYTAMVAHSVSCPTRVVPTPLEGTAFARATADPGSDARQSGLRPSPLRQFCGPGVVFCRPALCVRAIGGRATLRPGLQRDAEDDG
jgi:hypothetical protein